MHVKKPPSGGVLCTRTTHQPLEHRHLRGVIFEFDLEEKREES